jgi:LacI family transcriptional regulator
MTLSKERLSPFPDMKLTINQIAEIAHVAKSTVSKALNGQKGVSDGKRREILKLADSLNYEPSASAQALASSRSGSIGLLIPHEAGYSLAGAYWSAIITSVAQVANAYGHALLILTPPKGDDISMPVESVIRRRNVDGLIIGSEDLDPEITDRLAKEGIPFVFIGRNQDMSHRFVDVDNRKGGRLLVEHLIGSGYRRIACLAGPPEYLYIQDRIGGYRDALSAAGIAWSAVESTSYYAADVRRAVARIVGKHPDLDGLFITAGGDFVFDCIDALRLSGIEPRTFGLGVFDDYRFFDYIEPPVCAVRQPLMELGSVAARMLFDQLEGKPAAGSGRILDVELVLR